MLDPSSSSPSSSSSVLVGSMLSLLVSGACAPDRSPSEPPLASSAASAEGPAARCPWRSLDDVLLESPARALASLEVLEPLEVAEDLACLRVALEHQYVATSYYRERGIDLLARVDALAAELEGPVEPRALLERLLAIHDGAFDSHLGYFLDWSEGGEERTAAATQPYRWPYRLDAVFSPTEAGYRSHDDPALVLTTCEGLAPVEAIVDDQGRRGIAFAGQFPAEDGLPPRSVSCRDGEGNALSLDARAIANTGDSERGPLSYEREGDHLYVRIPFMDTEKTPAEQEVLEMLRATDGPTTVLLDLRNNLGGDDEFAFRLSAALRTRDQAIPDATATDLVSLHALASSVSLSRLYDNPAAEQQYLTKLRELEASGRRFTDPPTFATEAEALTEDLPRHGQRDEPYPGYIVLLVNKACVSSCESMIELLADLDQVEILGTHTFGAVSFGNIGVSVLPHSRIQFVGGWRNFGHVGVEGIGYAPDLYLAVDDPLAVATRYVRSKSRE